MVVLFNDRMFDLINSSEPTPASRHILLTYCLVAAMLVAHQLAVQVVLHILGPSLG